MFAKVDKNLLLFISGGGQRGTLRQVYDFYHFLTFQKPDICDFLLIWRLYILKLYFC